MNSKLDIRIATLALGLAMFGCDGIGQPDATITDASSPYYDRPCPLTQHADYPSDLIADCRCGTNQAPRDGIPICRRPFDAATDGLSVGEGPSMATVFNIEYNGGFLDEAEGGKGAIYVAYGFGASTEQRGGVMRIDLATGDRTLITGNTEEMERGEGPQPAYIFDVERRSDGKLLIRTDSTEANSSFLLVDPETGDREDAGVPRCEYTWEADVPDNLKSFSLVPEKGSFALDDQDRIYFGVTMAGGGPGGTGVMRIDLSKPDGEQCEVMTHTGESETIQRGEGPALGGFLRNVFLKDGMIYGMGRASKSMFRVDPETGDREVVVTIMGVTPAEQWAHWDEARGVWWMGGMGNGISIHAWDPEANVSAHVFEGGVFDFMPLGASGPIQINALNYAPFWFHSNGNLYAAQDGQSIVEFEPSTGNSVILSL